MGRRNEAGCEGYQGQIKGIPQDVIQRGGFRLPFFVGMKNLKKVSVTLDFTLKISDTVFNERGKAHRLPRLFENRREDGRKRRCKVAPQPSPQAGADTAEACGRTP